MKYLPTLPDADIIDSHAAFTYDRILAILLLVEADLIFEEKDVLIGKVLFYLLIRLAVVLARALHDVNLEHPRIFSTYVSTE